MHQRNILLRDFFSWILAFFIISAMTLFGQSQLRFIGMVMAGSFILYFLKNKQWLPTEMVIFFIWITWAFTTGYLVSIDKELFLKIWWIVFQIVIMSFAIAGLTARQVNLGINFLSVCIGGFIVVLLSIKKGDFMLGADVEAQFRTHGIVGNPNLYAYLLLLAISALFYFWGNSSSWKARFLIIMLIVAFTNGIIFSGSRKAFIGVIIFISMWSIMCYRKELLKKPFLIIAAICIIVSLYVTTNYVLSNTYMGVRFKKDFIEDPVYERARGFSRIIFYKEGFDIFKKHPIFGVGLGNFAVLSSLSSESHSDYVEVITSTGIVGFLLYYSIFFILWQRLCRIQKYINDREILYNVGLLKALVVLLLIEAFVRPHLTSQISWIILSSAIGYSWSLERKVRSLLRTNKMILTAGNQ